MMPMAKRKLSKSKWLEIQTNERLVHEVYLLLRDIPPSRSAPRQNRGA